MRHFENAFKFTFKNFLIVLPLIIAMVIPAIVMGIGSVGFLFNINNFQQIFDDAINSNNFSFGPEMIFNMYGPTMIICMIVAGILGLGLTIVAYPATYGMINKKYETGISKISDFGSCLSKYVGRYVLYLLLNFAIGIGLVLVLTILIGIGVVVTLTASKGIGILLIVLFTLAFIVGAITLNVYMSLWFPAVCIEDTGIIQGLKNSFKYVSGSFWSIFGIVLLISLCGSVISGLLSSILGLIPVVGIVAGTVVTTIIEFIKIVFFFEVYREKTGRFVSPEYLEQMNT